MQNYAGAGPNRQADVIADFDQKVIGTSAYSSLTDVWINASISGTGLGTPTQFYFQRWNAPTSAWVSLATFTTWGPHAFRVHFTGGNLTQFTNSLNAITLSNDFRVYARDNNNFQLNVNQIAMNYKTSNVINDVNHYVAIDSFTIDTTLLPDGWYNLTAKTRDVFGNYHQDTKWVRFDNTAPFFASSSYQPTAPVYDNESISILATITEQNIDFVIGKYINVVGVEIMHQETDIAFNHTDFFTNGSYNYQIRAVDKAGNYATSVVAFTVLHDVEFIYPTAVFFGDLIGNDYNVNLTTTNASFALIYLDSMLKNNVTGNTTFITTYNGLSEASHVLRIEVYDVKDRMVISNEYSFRVYYEPYINIYTNLNKRDYHVNVTTNHTREVKIYIDLLLVDTFPGNCTFVKTYLNLTETTHTIKFEIYDAIGILFNSTIRIFTVDAVTPYYLIFIDVIDGNTKLSLDYYGINTHRAEIYIDGDITYTVPDKTSLYVIIDTLSPGIHYIDIEIYNIDQDLYDSVTSRITIYAPPSGCGDCDSGPLTPPGGYPDAPNPPPKPPTGAPFASLTGEQSAWIILAGITVVSVGFIFYRLNIRRKSQPRSRRKGLIDYLNRLRT